MVKTLDFAGRLNPEQYAAVRHVGGPLLILAGAGSGKTRVLTHRIAHLILEADVSPSAIMAMTFTNKAAAEMAERVALLLEEAGLALEPGRGPWLGTFHRTCARLLRMHGDKIGIPSRFVIYDDGDQRSALKRAIAAQDVDVTPKFISQCSAYVDQCKNQGLTPDEAMEQAVGGEAEQLATVYAAYQRVLRAADCLDFGDLLLQTVKLLKASPEIRARLQRRWRFTMVDEFQDTNVVQYKLLQQLVNPETRNLAVVGDDDQSIYGWRGATVRNILDFTKDHPDAQVVKLEQNYRSTQVILDAAGAVIEKLNERTDKTLWTEQQGGELITAFTASHQREEAGWVVRQLHRLISSGQVDSRQCAVFYRTNAQARIFEEQFRAAGLSYQMVGGVSFYDRAEVKDILAYLKVALQPQDTINLLRIVNKPTRGLGKKTLEKLENLIVLDLGPQTLYEAMLYAMEHKLFKGRALKGLEEFTGLLGELRQRLEDGEPPSRITDELIDRVGFLAHLQKAHPADAEERKDNLMDLLAAMHQFEADEPGAGLEAFLERSSLVREPSEEDQAIEGNPIVLTPVTMMTIHASKGLEFDAVFVVGLEEGLFPLVRPNTTDEQIDEERRLFYVALTRARQQLFLTNARRRRPLGSPETRDTRPSRFLADIPPECLRIAAESVERKIIWREPVPTEAMEKRLKAARDAFDFAQPLPEEMAQIIKDQARKKRRRKKRPAMLQDDHFDQRPDEHDYDQVPTIEDEVDTSVSYSYALPTKANKPRKSAARSVLRKSPLRQKEPEPPAGSDGDDTLIGRTVTHSSQGIGEITDVSGHGPRATLTVLFAKSGKEVKVVRRFVKIY